MSASTSGPWPPRPPARNGRNRKTRCRISERAQLQWIDLGDLAGVGRALVDKGLWSSYLGRFETAIEASEAALQFLPKKARPRLVAIQNLVLSYRARGLLDRAREQLELARTLSPDGNPWAAVPHDASLAMVDLVERQRAQRPRSARVSRRSVTV